MPTATRDRILDYLQVHQTASVSELARVLRLTGANIRHHLTILKSNGLVQAVGHHREGSGRPKRLYGLSNQLLGDNLGSLAGAVLNEYLKDGESNNLEKILKSVAQQLRGENSIDGNLQMTRRLAAAEENLNQHHYRARWEAAAAGPRFILGHCPYSEIILEHPELCRMDRYLLESLLGQSVVQTAKLHSGVKGLPYCEFKVG